MMDWLNPIGADASAWLTLEVVRATVVLLAAAGGAVALRRASAAARHLVWCAALASLLVLPAVSRAVPWRWSALPSPGAGVARAEAPPGTVVDVAAHGGVPALPEGDRITGEAPRAGAAVPSLTARVVSSAAERGPAIVLLLWAAGALFSLGRLVVGGIALRAAVRRGRTLDDIAWRRPLYEAADRLHLRVAPRLVVSDRMPMPFVTGLLRPTIVLPSVALEWPAERRRAVLVHELAHVRRRDLVLNVLAHLARALWWFHPLAHVAVRRLRAESERACDDLVLRLGTLPSAYAQDLLHIVRAAGRGATPAAALPLAQRHEFEGRMLAILEADARRDPPRRRHALLAVVAFALLVVPLAGLGPAPLDADASDPAATPLERSAVADADAVGVEGTPDRPARVSREAGAPNGPVEADAAVDAAASGAVNADAGSWHGSMLPTAQDTGVVEALRAALRDPSGDVRSEAAWALGSMRATAAAPDLMALLDGDDSAEARRMAIWSLAQLGHAAGADAIARAVRSDPDDEVREMAVWALGQFAEPGTLGALVAALGDATPEVRAAAAWAIGTLHPDDAPAALIAALGDEDGEVRESAAWAVGQTGDADAVPALARLITDPDAGEAALWAIGRIGGDAARPALMEALRSGSDEARAAAARALAGRGSHPWPRPQPRPIIRD